MKTKVNTKIRPSDVDTEAKSYLNLNEEIKGLVKKLDAKKSLIKEVADHEKPDAHNRHLLYGDTYAIGYCLVDQAPTIDEQAFERYVEKQYREECYTRSVDPAKLARLIELGKIKAEVVKKIVIESSPQKRIFVDTIEKAKKD